MTFFRKWLIWFGLQRLDRSEAIEIRATNRKLKGEWYFIPETSIYPMNSNAKTLIECLRLLLGSLSWDETIRALTIYGERCR